MKLLAVEAHQYATYHRSRYELVDGWGVRLFVLNGIGTDGYWHPDRYRVAGSQHIDDLVAAAREWHADEHFDGVFTFAESSVVAVAVLADALGLPGIGVDAALTSRNKLLMRRAHERGAVPHPRFRSADDLPAALAAADELGYPAVLKPTMGSASSFVFRVNDPGELRRRHRDAVAGLGRMPGLVREAQGVDLGPGGLLLESFLDGDEYLCEAVVWDGEVYLGSVVDRVTVEGDTFDDDVHSAPTTLDADRLAEVHQVVETAARAQGLVRSVLHAEVRFHRGAAHLLEMAVRPGGGGLDLVARVTADHCPVRAVLDVARGVRPALRHYAPTGVHMLGTCLISDGGLLEYARIPDEVRRSERTLMAEITATPGQVILRPPDGNNIIGFLVVTGSSADEVRRTLREYAARIEIKLVGRPPSTTATPWSSASLV